MRKLAACGAGHGSQAASRVETHDEPGHMLAASQASRAVDSTTPRVAVAGGDTFAVADGGAAKACAARPLAAVFL